MRIFLLAVLGLTLAACSQGSGTNGQYVNDAVAGYGTNVSKAMREDALRRAKVWMEPSVPVERFNFLEGVASEKAVRSTDEIKCKWDYQEEQSGATPKLRCKTDDGKDLKVKYSKKNKNNNGEIPAEIAATRLLRALGFGADEMYTAKRVRCVGCPSDPWAYTMHLHHASPEVRKRFLYTYGKQDRNGDYYYTPDFSRYTDFTFNAIENKFGKHSIEVKGKEGWRWKELERVSAARGGSTRAEIDAFVLMAVFLYHTDNKVAQQRVVCLDALTEKGHCARPMLIMQDLGASFGNISKNLFGAKHEKFSVEAWRSAPLWEHPSECRVDIEGAPFLESFEESAISEAGRLHLANLLSRLSDQQIRDLFVGARAHEYKNQGEAVIAQWVEAFKYRRSLIVNHKCAN